MNSSKHSAMPWRVSKSNTCVVLDSTDEIACDTYGSQHPRSVEEANAALVVRAVNSHDQLVAALNKIASGSNFEAALVAQKALDAAGLRPGAA